MINDSNSRSLDRRSFLRGSALFAAAIGLSVVPGLAEGRLVPPMQQPTPPPPTPKPNPKPEEEKEEEKQKEKEKEKSKDGKLYDKDGREYRVCPQCAYNMYKQGRMWVCENCGYSYVE